jgi:hypothetical protein
LAVAGAAEDLADRARAAFAEGVRLREEPDKAHPLFRRDDRDLQQLLSAAREQVVYPQPGAFARPPVRSRPPWLPRLPSRAGLLLACAAYALGWASLARWGMVRRGPLLTVGLIALAVAALLALAVTAEEVQQRDEEARPLVVIASDGVLLRKGNAEAYPRRYEAPLNRGVEARLLFERGEWLQIELSGGETGWVRRANALIDRPYDRGPTG